MSGTRSACSWTGEAGGWDDQQEEQGIIVNKKEEAMVELSTTKKENMVDLSKRRPRYDYQKRGNEEQGRIVKLGWYKYVKIASYMAKIICKHTEIT